MSAPWPRLLPYLTLAALACPTAGCMAPLQLRAADAALEAGRPAEALARYDRALATELKDDPEAADAARVRRGQAVAALLARGRQLATEARLAGQLEVALGRLDLLEQRSHKWGAASDGGELRRERQTVREAVLRQEAERAAARQAAGEMAPAFGSLWRLVERARQWGLPEVAAELAGPMRQAAQAVVRQELAAAERDLTAGRAAPAFARLLDLRERTRQWQVPELRPEVDARLAAAAEAVWTGLEPRLAPPGDLAALATAEALAAPLAPAAAVAQRLAAARARLAAAQVALADAAAGRPMTRRLHLHLAHRYGAAPAADLPALDRAAAVLGKLAYVLQIQAPPACQPLARALAAKVERGAGTPVQVALRFERCDSEDKHWVTQQTVRRSRQVPYTSQHCTTSYRCTGGNFTSGPKSGQCISGSNVTTCTPTTSYRTEYYNETVTTKHTRYGLVVAGSARLTWDGGERTVPLGWQARHEVAQEVRDGVGQLVQKAAHDRWLRLHAESRPIQDARAAAAATRARRAEQAGVAADALEAWLENALIGVGPPRELEPHLPRLGVAKAEVPALLAGRPLVARSELPAHTVPVPSGEPGLLARLGPRPDPAIQQALLLPTVDVDDRASRWRLRLPKDALTAKGNAALAAEAFDLAWRVRRSPLADGALGHALAVAWTGPTTLRAEVESVRLAGASNGFAVGVLTTSGADAARPARLATQAGLSYARHGVETGGRVSNLAFDLAFHFALGDHVAVSASGAFNLLAAWEWLAGPDPGVRHWTPLEVGVTGRLGRRAFLQVFATHWWGSDGGLEPGAAFGVRL